MDVIGEATNEMNSKTVTAIAYGTAKAKYVLPQNVPYGFKTPEMVPILVSATNLRRGPIEAADELPGIVTYYNGERNLNSIKVDCTIYANKDDCFHQSFCGWCGASSSCITGNVNGPIGPCNDVSSYIFSPPAINFGSQVTVNNQGVDHINVSLHP